MAGMIPSDPMSPNGVRHSPNVLGKPMAPAGPTAPQLKPAGKQPQPGTSVYPGQPANGVYPPGQGPVTGRVPARSPVMPSTVTPQPAAINQVGNLPPPPFQLPPGAKLAAAVSGVTQAILKAADLMPGGLADNKPDRLFAKRELLEAAKDESEEHTNSLQVAKEIAKDHLTEDPNYYKKSGVSAVGESGLQAKQAPVAYGAQINLGDVMRRTRVDGTIPPQGYVRQIFKDAVRNPRAIAVDADIGDILPAEAFRLHQRPKVAAAMTKEAIGFGWLKNLGQGAQRFGQGIKSVIPGLSRAVPEAQAATQAMSHAAPAAQAASHAAPAAQAVSHLAAPAESLAAAGGAAGAGGPPPVGWWDRARDYGGTALDSVRGLGQGYLSDQMVQDYTDPTTTTTGSGQGFDPHLRYILPSLGVLSAKVPWLKPVVRWGNNLTALPAGIQGTAQYLPKLQSMALNNMAAAHGTTPEKIIGAVNFANRAESLLGDLGNQKNRIMSFWNQNAAQGLPARLWGAAKTGWNTLTPQQQMAIAAGGGLMGAGALSHYLGHPWLGNAAGLGGLGLAGYGLLGRPGAGYSAMQGAIDRLPEDQRAPTATAMAEILRQYPPDELMQKMTPAEQQALMQSVFEAVHGNAAANEVNRAAGNMGAAAEAAPIQ